MSGIRRTMARKISVFLAAIWSRLSNARGARLAAILTLPILFAGTAFTLTRWTQSATRALQPAILPVTGQQISTPRILSFAGAATAASATDASATALPFSPATPTLPAHPVEPNCVQPPGWSPYMVSLTDSLDRLSVTYGITSQLLKQANCLENTSLILPGQLIYVPDLLPGQPDLPLAAIPTPTPSPAPFALNSPELFTVNLPPAKTDPVSSQPQSQPPVATAAPQPQPPAATAALQPALTNTMAPVVSHDGVQKISQPDHVREKPPKEKKLPPLKPKVTHPKHPK